MYIESMDGLMGLGRVSGAKVDVIKTQEGIKVAAKNLVLGRTYYFEQDLDMAPFNRVVFLNNRGEGRFPCAGTPSNSILPYQGRMIRSFTLSKPTEADIADCERRKERKEERKRWFERETLYTSEPAIGDPEPDGIERCTPEQLARGCKQLTPEEKYRECMAGQYAYLCDNQASKLYQAEPECGCPSAESGPPADEVFFEREELPAGSEQLESERQSATAGGGYTWLWVAGAFLGALTIKHLMKKGK